MEIKIGSLLQDRLELNNPGVRGCLFFISPHILFHFIFKRVHEFLIPATALTFML